MANQGCGETSRASGQIQPHLPEGTNHLSEGALLELPVAI